MRPIARGRRAEAALAALAALAACRPAPVVDVALHVAPAVAAPGDTVRLVLAVRNARRDSLRLAFGPGCAARFLVRHAAERWAAHPVPDPCAVPPRGDSTHVVLAPGDTWTTERRWVARSDDPARPMVAGAYVVAASIEQHHAAVGRRRAGFHYGEGIEVPLAIRSTGAAR